MRPEAIIKLKMNGIEREASGTADVYPRVPAGDFFGAARGNTVPPTNLFWCVVNGPQEVPPGSIVMLVCESGNVLHGTVTSTETRRHDVRVDGTVTVFPP
jgi:hypothetical protein